MSEKTDNPRSELPAGYELFVFDQTEPSLLAKYETSLREGDLTIRAKSFAKFLREYVDRNNRRNKPMISRIGEIQKNLSELSREERYTNSANVLFGVIAELSSPDKNFETWFKEDEDVKEMRSSVEGDTDPHRLQDPHELAAAGQRLKVITFYEDAKRYFFSDLFPYQHPMPEHNYDDLYTPTETVEQLLTFNPKLLEEVKAESPKSSEFGLMERYCQAASHRVAEVEPDVIRARSANDGNNIVYTIIMYANLEEDGDARKFVASGRDLELACGMLKDKIERGYGNLSSYKLWANLYLGLREELFGPEQKEENIELINQLRETIAS